MAHEATLPARRGLFQPLNQPPFGEFVALVAMMFATVSLSIDAMLPALPQIAADLGLTDPNRAQLVVTAFVAGMGLGQIVSGPMSDSFGRRPVIAFGIGLYIIGAAAAWAAQSLDLMLAARFLQGLGISAPRTAAVAMVRDRYEGRMMARVMSFVMTLFMLVPAMAPFFGQIVMSVAGWRGIFAGFAIAGSIAVLWMMIRQPETLPPENRQPFRPAVIWAAMREVMAHPLIRLYTLAVSLGLGVVFAFISSVQQIYDVSFGMADSFALWFAIQALIAASAGPLNARLVMRLGMRRLATIAFLLQMVLSLLMALAWETGVVGGFPTFFAWAVSIFFLNGLLFSNLNTLALEPVGHIAGLAASTVGAISTLAAVLIAVPVGLAFNGTPTPLILGTAACATTGYVIMQLVRRRAPF